MSKELYKALAEHIMHRAKSIPVINCPEFEALISELFTPAQAEAAINFPAGLISAQEMATKLDRPEEEMKAVIESMADAGLVFTGSQEGTTVYRLMDVLPGFFEFQFMKGGTSERDRVLARLFQDYFDKLTDNMKNVPEPFKKLTPFSRVIPVDKDIAGGNVIHPYETVSEYINKTDYITVSQCYCRHHSELLGDPCEFPKEVCMAFGPNAKYVAERGFGRRVSKEEAIEILDDIERKGLVHISSNTSKYIDFICNCCACHCGVLKSFVESDAPSMGVISNFELEINEDDCIGCDLCIDKCPVQALSLKNEVVAVDQRRCIGCGVCNVACASGVLSMKRRTDEIEPPVDRKALGERIMDSLKHAIKEVETQNKQ